jgi:hypothetical protein
MKLPPVAKLLLCSSFVLLFTLWTERSQVSAQGGWMPPVGGFDYTYNADDGQAAYVVDLDASGCLDGSWRRSSTSDQWDGSSPLPGSMRPDGQPGAPGGAAIDLLPGEGDGGGDASVLDIEDVGDPRAQGFADPSNRGIFLWRNTSAELNLFEGITLLARWRRDPAPKSAAFQNNGGPLAVPNGTYLHDQNKGQIGFVQKRAVLPGTVAAGLGFAITDEGQLQFAQDFNGSPCPGASDELCFDVDEEDWVSVWMTAKEDPLTFGGIQVKVFLDGAATPTLDTVLRDIRADSEAANLPESGGTASSYVYLALGSTLQQGAIQIDYVSFLNGTVDPVADCNANNVPDSVDIELGSSADCNANGRPDECELSRHDCNASGVPDDCDISSGESQDCNLNGRPDECELAELDCNQNSQPDDCDLASGISPDCNANQSPDECDIASGSSPDCNANGVPDSCDLAAGTSRDCNASGIPDECELKGSDCNSNSVPDDCDVASGTSPDCNANGIPDSCDVASGKSPDCNLNGVPDSCDVASGTSPDCNSNGIPDSCDILSGLSIDCNLNGVPDICDVLTGTSPDCNSNGIPDSCDVALGTSPDCNSNGVPDDCDVLSGTSPDCNLDGRPDECDIASGSSPDCDLSGVPDECEIASGARPDCNVNGVPDSCDVKSGDSLDLNGNGTPDECDDMFIRGDSNCDGSTDLSDSVWSLNFLFRGGPAPCCGDSADANDDGNVDISDPVRTLNFLFRGSPPPPAPGPDVCGIDLTEDDVEERFGACRYPMRVCAPAGEK